MSHEIRTPMNGVLGMATLLEATQLDTTQQDYIQTIMHSGENLLSIINEILDFSKIEAGKMVLESRDFDLEKLIQNTINLASNRASACNNTITTAIHSEVPAVVKGDYGRITQVLNNLIGNAIKFTENGLIEILVDNSIDNAGLNHVRFEVKDSGIGIEPEKLSQLFQPFSQADSSVTRKYGGTGLGLAICKQLVELMNGITASRIILHQEQDPPMIVALTANVVNESKEECSRVGMKGFIHKPFKTDEIIQKIKEAHQIKIQKD